MKYDYLTTSQVAELYAVTPDTVLKWVNNGKIQSTKTVGGHCRILLDRLPPDMVEKWHFLQKQKEDPGSLYCWEYIGGPGLVKDVCRECIVRRAMAKNCYVLTQILKDKEYHGHACPESCESCDYFHLITEEQVE